DNIILDQDLADSSANIRFAIYDIPENFAKQQSFHFFCPSFLQV
ncbi:unnamed protein product, partial [marine sediment metagenome]